MRGLTVLFFLLISLGSFGNILKVYRVKSKSMNKRIGVTVILPDGYSEDRKYSVIYVLHGWGQSFRTFGKVREIRNLADKYDVILVFPDGNWNSWYVDSKIRNGSSYSTFISKELVAFMDENFHTVKDRRHRAITGFSMGGFGAFYNGINNSEVFGNIGSVSGGLNVQRFQKKWGIQRVIGSGNDENLWNEYNIYRIIHRLKENGEKTNIIVECGKNDFFLGANRQLVKTMRKLDIEHSYEEREGNHDKKFWKKAIENQASFFAEKFRENMPAF